MARENSCSECYASDNGANYQLDECPSEGETESKYTISLDPGELTLRGREVVRDIEAMLKTAKYDPNLYQEIWSEEKERLANMKPLGTLIAICGATGAGKSSLLNAILEDNIVPTSGMHACTSVVTEIAYHDKPTIDGVVSFLSEAEWKNEIEVLLKDMLDDMGNKLNKRPADLRNEAKVAWQKVHSIYPSISLDQLVNMKPETIIERDPQIVALLGKEHQISAGDSATFREGISRYINATERSSGFKNRTDATPAQPTLWPLIRQVTIRCRAQALSTGAVLADLPGVADSNAARNNVAKEYMKKCDHFWILAPITRAVDDKVARDMLNQAFKLQLRYGNYRTNSITFVATKTDDVSCNEIIQSLGLHDDPELQRIESLLAQYDTDLNVWEKSRMETEYIYRESSHQVANKGAHPDGKKRKAEAEALCASMAKKLKHVEDLNGPIIYEDNHDPIPETINLLPASLRHLKVRKESVRALQLHRDDMLLQKNAFCALKRSEYSREILKQDFRDGIYDDYEGPAVEDSENFQDEDKPDLPVFLCSSRDYSRIKGFVKGEGRPQCFSNSEDTGIPALQRHCQELARMPCRAHALKCLAQVKALANDIRSFVRGIDDVTLADRSSFRAMWETKTKHGGKQAGVTSASMGGQSVGIEAQLIRKFDRMVEQKMGRLKRWIDNELSEACERGVQRAAESAVQTFEKMSEDLKWQTYLALVRRGGAIYDHDLNMDLSVPFQKAITPVWEIIFKDVQWNTLRGVTLREVDKFLSEKVERSAESTFGLQRAIKRQSLNCRKTVGGSMHNVVKRVKDRMDEKTKDASRAAVNHITKQLQPGFDRAKAVTGKGCVARQKKILWEFILKKRAEIFRGAANVMLEELRQAIDSVKHDLQVDFRRISREVEFSMSLLWKSGLDTRERIQEREVIVSKIEKIIKEINTWTVTNAEALPAPGSISIDH